MSESFDLIVLGAGSGGLAAAKRAASEVGNAAGEVCRLTGERILIAVGGRPHRPEIPGAELGWVKRLLASGNVSLIDVRIPVEYRAGHIAGAINRPLNDLSERSQPPRGCDFPRARGGALLLQRISLCHGSDGAAAGGRPVSPW